MEKRYSSKGVIQILRRVSKFIVAKIRVTRKPLSYDQFIYQISVERYGVKMADWMAKEFGWKT